MILRMPGFALPSTTATKCSPSVPMKGNVIPNG